MLYRRNGLPEEDELVLCTVTQVFPHSVFCNLDEFDRTAVIHISEIAPGRIRNIRDYVKEGKKVICKVLRINPQRGHIDLSLRRANEGQKRIKRNEIKQEILAEKIIEFIARKQKKDLKELYNLVTDKVFEKYMTLYSCFEDVINQGLDLETLGIDPKLADEITEVIKLRIKPPEVEIKGKFHMSIKTGDGINTIKEALKIAQNSNSNAEINYESAGKYGVLIKAPDYHEAEAILKELTETVIEYMGSKKGEAEFIRKK
ncbi:MAG: translation initiation factor IF-2 subunit alpha [Nanoarchaeota archaeon]|nr:translation initiation factor IF-2 subunit alpha [Nanoarchaeota archaeon]